MPDQHHLQILELGKDVWNTWRRENDVTPNLRSADLSGMNLSGYDLHDAYLRKARLKQAKLEDTQLREANLSGANLCEASLARAGLAGANLRSANLQSADLSDTNLMSAILTQADLSNAKLVNAMVYGISAWDVKLKDAYQERLLASRPDQAQVFVDDLEIAQLAFLLIDHKKLRSVLDETSSKCVLILGRFGNGGLQVLSAIGQKLRTLGYLPIIFDFERPQDRTVTETVITLAGLSAFAIVDLSGRSVPQELNATVPTVRIPFIPILSQNDRAHSMVTDLATYSNFLYPPVRFDSTEQLVNELQDKILGPAIAMRNERTRRLQDLLDDR